MVAYPNQFDAAPDTSYYEPLLGVASYEHYRAVCDAADSYRYLGLRDEQDYLAAVNDPRTVFCDIGGARVPAITPLEHEQGYDTEHTAELVDRPTVLLLSVPIELARAGMLEPDYLSGGKNFPERFAIVIEQSQAETSVHDNQDRQRLLDALSVFGSLESGEFTDPRWSDSPDNQTAWVGLYSSSAGPREGARREFTLASELLNPDNLAALKSLYEAEIRQLGMTDPTALQPILSRLVSRYIDVCGDPRYMRLPEDLHFTPGNPVDRQHVSSRMRGVIAQTMSMSYGDLRSASAEVKRLAHAEGPEAEAARFAYAWQLYSLEQGLPTIPGPHAQETYLLTPTQLQAHPEIVEALWAISNQGFGKILGAYHPVSMDENRAFFEAQLFSGSSVTAIRFEDGRPACFGSVTFDPKACFWMNTASPVLAKELASIQASGEHPLIFSEIISTNAGRSDGVSYSKDVLRLIADLAAMSDERYRLLFESTNMSAMYIPRIVRRLLTRHHWIRFNTPDEQVRMVDRTKYWYVRTIQN